MEREVSDTEGVFSRRLVGNWAELPTTLRRRQKHRPDILSQFTDYSESSENELHGLEAKSFSNVRRIVRRSEFLRKLECGDPARERRSTFESPLDYLDEDYRKHYASQETKLGRRKRGNFICGQDVKSFSDEDRKTNSPDSLLMKSSESELSSDEYTGHTDDSGAFLGQATRTETETPKTERSGFIKFFGGRDGRRKKSKKDSDVHLDVNRNIKSEIVRREFGQQKYEYENIPRIDVSKLDQNSLLSSIVRASNRRPSIGQLRLEEGCELRNSKNTAASSKNARDRKPVPAKSKDEEPKARSSDAIQEQLHADAEQQQQIAARANGERKMAKTMETIAEERADGSKLSVREILKKFEELRTQSETQTAEEKASDKTLTTIQETLKKLDEKVKSYQVVRTFQLSQRVSLSLFVLHPRITGNFPSNLTPRNARENTMENFN